MQLLIAREDFVPVVCDVPKKKQNIFLLQVKK